MESNTVKNAIIKEITGRSPADNTGMLIGMGMSIAVLAGLGAGVAVVSGFSAGGEPSAGGILLGAVIGIGIGFVGGFIGDQMGWWESDLDGVAEALTYDSEDYMADKFGIKSWNYENERQGEIMAAGLFLATFQFLFGTLWGGVKYFTGGDKAPLEGFRGPVAVTMYLHQAGRTSQAKIVNGLNDSGLPEGETVRGIAILKKIGYVVGNADGFMLTQKAKDGCETK